MGSSHLLLGAGSLLGAALLAEHEDRGDEVHCLAPGGDRGPLPERVDHVWDARQFGHFDDEPEAVRSAIDAGLRLAGRSGARRYHLFSSTDAYADVDGTIAFDTVADAVATTPGRRARIDAERRLGAAGPVAARVLRTGMALGPMADADLQPAGLYALLQLLRRLRANVDAAIGHFLSRRRLTILSSATASVELIAAADAARIAAATADEEAPVAHLVGGCLTVGTVLEAIAEVAGLRAIECVEDPAFLTSIDRTVDADLRTQPMKRRGEHRFEATTAPGGPGEIDAEALRTHLLS